MDNDEARRLLLAERERLTGLLSDAAETVADQQDHDPSAADEPTDIVDREVQRSEMQRAQQELAEVDDALQRLEDGTYGISDVSGEPIPDERLRAVPHARRLVDEQEVFDRQARASSPSNPDLAR